MWDVKGIPLSIKFENWVPDRVLYDFDGPRIFTVRHELGDFLAYACDEGDEIARYLLAPTSDGIIAALEKGSCTVREALAQPWLWVVDVGFNDVPRQVWRSTLEAIPETRLPKPWAMLCEQVEVRGRLLRHQPQPTYYTLTREASRRVGRARTQREPQATPLTATGLIEEFDKGRLTFILRYTDKDHDINCAIADELYDEVMELFQQDEVRATIFGLEVSGNRFVEVIHIARVPETPVEGSVSLD